MRGAVDSDGQKVRERLARVVGLPRIDDDPAPPPAGEGPPSPDVGIHPDQAAPNPGLAALNPGRRGVRALALVAVIAVVAAGVAAWWARPRAEPIGVRAEASAVASAAGPTAGAVVVAVHGRVHRPGLVRLPAGARVADAVEAAGGVLPGTDLSFVNLARKLVDGELILIGVTPPPGTGDAAPAGDPAGPVNLNTATAAQLERLPGVGPALAQRIIDYRNRHGGFRSVSELRQVDGVGDVRYAQLKDLVCV